MTADDVRPVTIRGRGRDGHDIIIDTAGKIVPSAPGLLITPLHEPDIVPGRFCLTVESGYRLAELAWCPHEVRRWAIAAGWIGVDWRTDPADLVGSGPVQTFARRLFDEFEPRCAACPASPVDARFEAGVRRMREGAAYIHVYPPSRR